MTRFRLSILALVTVIAIGLAHAQSRSIKPSNQKKTTHVMMTPGEMKWGPGPPSLPAGAELAVLSGDPSKAGSAFTVRAKFPAGYKVPPHWHPTDENVVVISGTMMFGLGTKFDEAEMHESPVGTFAIMPAGTRHFAMAKEESIVQIYGTGPFAVNYVNPADDPRKAK
jgi:quercetin dioxygenase-like cupin family protein